MFCEKCGTQLNEGAKFCGSCGAVQDTGAEAASAVTAFCAKCGAQLEEGMRFCVQCGADQAAGSQAPAAAYSAPPPAPQQTAYAPPVQGQYQAAYSAAPKPNPWQHFTGAFKKYAVCKGRARRAEFWCFTLFYGLFSVLFSFIDKQFSFLIAPGIGLLSTLWGLAGFLPSLGLVVRRMHDCDKAGPYCLIPIYGWIVLPCTEGTRGPNRFGPDPKQA